jgi:AcrR family transcriptional regulator
MVILRGGLAMGTRARREKEKENMRNAILEAATKIILEDGYEKLTMRKVAAAIEYTPTTIYSYYKDKAQIVDDILQEVYQKIVFNIAEALEENKTAPVDKQLELGFTTFINGMVDNAEMGKAIIRSGSKAMFGDREISEPPEVSGIAILQSLLFEGQQQSTLRKMDDNASWMLITALLGFSMNAIENQLYLSKEWHSMVKIYVDMLMKGLLSKNN